MVDSWNIGVKPDKIFTTMTQEFRQKYPTEPTTRQQEFIEHVVKQHLRPETNISFDCGQLPAGRCAVSSAIRLQYETLADYLQAFRAVSKPGTAFFTNGEETSTPTWSCPDSQKQR